MANPKQELNYAVWVRVDDGVGWRIVHESDTKDSCYRIGGNAVVHAYPVLNVEIRDQNQAIEVLWKYEGSGA